MKQERVEEAVRMGPLAELVGYRLRRASAAMGADYSDAMQELGVRQVHFGMLSVIAENPGIGQGVLGRALGIQRANMVPLVTMLADRGLVLREVAAADRRALELRLSPAGEQLLAACMDRIRMHEDRMLAHYSIEERAQLVDLLGRIEPARNGPNDGTGSEA